MDIELLAKMVEELILEHDEVALPGLGTFVAEMVPASFSDKGFTINPPYRRLSFRQREGGDRHLIEFYASANDVAQTAAERMISQFVGELRSELISKKSVVFPKLGKLRATKENHFFFVPDEDLSIYPEGFGLIPVSLKSHQETSEELSEAIKNLKEIVSPEAAPESAPQSIPESAPGAVPETAPEVLSAPEVVPEAVQAAGPERQPELERRGLHPLLVTLLVAAGLAVVFFVSLAVLGRVAPQFIDPLLYSAEELQIINM